MEYDTIESQGNWLRINLLQRHTEMGRTPQLHTNSENGDQNDRISLIYHLLKEAQNGS